jgi:hypothetical protein
MVSFARRFSLAILGCLFLILAVPLRAQLDTRLMAGQNDFLDLYQQSSSSKAKPEIITVFDYSGSMASLMFHPLYQNNDKGDDDDVRFMSFTYKPAVAGALGSNKYTIKAASSGTCKTSAQVDLTVNADNSVTLSGASNPIACNGSGATGAPTSFVATVSAVGNGSAKCTFSMPPLYTTAAVGSNNTPYKATANTPTATASNATGPYTINNTSVAVKSPIGATSPYAPGTVLILTAYLTHPVLNEQEPGADKTFSWSMNSGGFNSTPTWQQVSVGNYVSTVEWKVPTYTYTAATTGTPNQLQPVTMTETAPHAGDTVHFSTYYVSGKASNITTLAWTATRSGTILCSLPAATYPGPILSGSPSTATITSGGSVTWKIPPYCSTQSGRTAAYVQVQLDPRVGTTVIQGITYLTANMTAGAAYVPPAVPVTGLVKPDGSLVTEDDFPATYTSNSAPTAITLLGSGLGIADVRNWIRMASHVRFTGSNSRTIDIPIPWEVTTRASTGFPLTPYKIPDRQIKTGVAADGSPTTTNYGTGLSLEVDESYKIENANGGVLTLDATGTKCTASATTTVYLYSVLYRPAYISWLFTGTYSNTAGAMNYTPDIALGGKFIAYEAIDKLKVAAGQPATPAGLTWGQGYGPSAGNWNTTITVPTYNLDGSYKAVSAPTDASAFATPALTRLQACKKAALATWISHQADVLWAFRFLDPAVEANVGTASTITNSCLTTSAGGDATTTHTNGNDSAWTVLNNGTADPTNSLNTGNSYVGMRRIASVFANGQTPLTYAMARTLAQYCSANNVFNGIVGTNVSQCANSYLILFTDGIDNNAIPGTPNANSASAYIPDSSATAAGTTFSALTGNRAIITTPALIDRTGANWNLFTFAAIGAHLGDSALGVANTDWLPALNPETSVTSGSPSAFLPLAIYERGTPATVYSKAHRVTTMTVGVSLGGQYTDISSPKRSLFLAAVMGDPATTSGDLSSFRSFVGSDDEANDWVKSDSDPTSYPTYGKKKDGAVYFFDATDASKLSSSLDYALRLAISAGGNNATSNPNLPYVGASLGKQVYIGKFQTPKTGGVVWPGDLLMFGTRQDSQGNFSLVDTAGNITLLVDQTTAQWSTATALLNNRLWSARKLFTRLPGNATNSERGLKAFSDVGATYSNPDALDNTAGLKNYVALPAMTVGSAAQQAIIQNAMGGLTTGTLDGSNRPTANRTNIMGDVIDSSPASLEYKFSDSTITTGISNSTVLSALATPNRFRLILVGTNQGWLHAFAEVSKTTTVVDAAGVSQEVVKGVVDEAWSFMPTDFLANLNYPYGVTSGSNTHRFMVDGTPAIYFLDLPPTAGGQGNGVLDYNADASAGERSIAVIGLGKGGRSYYALDIRDPFNPAMKWSLVPDEAAFLPHSRNLTPLTDDALRTLIGNMGFATCTPGVGRVVFTANGVTKLRDVVFLGGGLSVPDVEANFAGTKLGRSVLAIDVYTGEILSAATLPDTAGPVVAGLVPFEYIVGSGMAQRAYFLDRFGGLWAWGSMGTPESSNTALYPTYKDYRVDTSDLSKWTANGNAQTATNLPALRKVYQDGSATGLTQPFNAVYSTLPSPFRVGSFPGKGKNGAIAPTAAGIAIISGDRNNPLDYNYNKPPAYDKPLLQKQSNQHRLTVVFDRQDSKLWSLDTNGITDDASFGAGHLRNFTANTLDSSTNASPCLDTVLKNITPGCDDFYLAPKTGDPWFGYIVNLPALSGSFTPKGINPPMVVAGSLFYTYFKPTSADPCTGGNGLSYSNMIADVMSPVVTDNRTNVAAKSGLKYTWSGVASNYSTFGTRGVFQGGSVAVTNPPPGGAATTPLMQNFQGKSQERYPKARVWRTVQ